jgi:RNA polymerase subunit RPABC4/transcription elongation factor Spt4
MRYCYNCNRITQGEPLFCQYCGRTYAVKLCPRLHKNPRNAQICSQCGSHDLSTPAPKQPFWISLAVFGLSLVPGFLLFAISILFVVGLLHALMTNPRMLLAFGFLALALTVLWAMWTRLPLALRQWIRKRLLDREKERRP